MRLDLEQQILSMDLTPLDLEYKLHQNNGIWFHVRKIWSSKNKCSFPLQPTTKEAYRENAVK
jgi:hypothetical protein